MIDYPLKGMQFFSLFRLWASLQVWLSPDILFSLWKYEFYMWWSVLIKVLLREPTLGWSLITDALTTKEFSLAHVNA